MQNGEADVMLSGGALSRPPLTLTLTRTPSPTLTLFLNLAPAVLLTLTLPLTRCGGRHHAALLRGLLRDEGQGYG